MSGKLSQTTATTSLFLVSSKAHPKVVILCTELHLLKWIHKLTENGELPDVMPVTTDQLRQMIRPSPRLN